MELSGPMATVAFHTLTMLRAGRRDVLNAEGKPVEIDSCLAYAGHRGVVERRWPAFHSGLKRAPEGSESPPAHRMAQSFGYRIALQPLEARNLAH